MCEDGGWREGNGASQIPRNLATNMHVIQSETFLSSQNVAVVTKTFVKTANKVKVNITLGIQIHCTPFHYSAF